MPEKKKKQVLLVGGNENLLPCLQNSLSEYGSHDICGYAFIICSCATVNDSVDMLRSNHYDAVVIDTWPEAERAAFWLCRCLNEQFGPELPLKIIVDKPNYDHCIEAARLSVLDYIIKTVKGHTGDDEVTSVIARRIATSVVKGLVRLDLRKELEKKICGKWLSESYYWIEKTYGGQLFAIRQGEEGIAILVSGQDAFELEQKLFYWREENPDKELLIVRIPAPATKEKF